MNLFQDIRSREYGVDDILKKTLKGVFGPAFWDLAGPAMIFALAAYGISTVVMFASTDRMGEWMQSSYSPDGSIASLPGFFAMQAMWFLLWVAVMVLAVVCVQYVLHRMKQFILNEPEPPLLTLRRCLDPLRFLDFVITGFIAMVMVMIGSIFCFIPGMALSFVFILLPACLTFGDDRFRVPIAQPFRLISERFWKTVAVILVMGFGFSIISMIFSFPLSALYMRGMGVFGPQSDFNAMWQDQITLMTNPGIVILGGVSAFVTALYWVVIGFASVVIYLNYSSVAPTPAVAVAPSALRKLYEIEKLQDRLLSTREDLAGVYSETSDEGLLDVYQHIDTAEHQDKFMALLAEIKRRVESRRE